jgi:acetylglutamate kinase
MEKYLEKVNTLIEALPYIKSFNDKAVVIKYGGSAMESEKLKASVIEDIVLMKLVGMKPIVVHGGGKAISGIIDQMGLETNFIDGLRVTDNTTIEAVEMVLSGKINKELVQLLQNHRVNAVGISGKDGNTIKVEKKEFEGKDLGYVGEITKVDTHLLHTLINENFLPVIAPIGTDENGQTYNINADHAAFAIAAALNAEKLIYLTDTSGILANKEDPDSRIAKLNIVDIPMLIEDGSIAGGMIPKAENSVAAIKNGVHSVHILDGRLEHALLLETFTKSGIGTMITDSFYKGEVEN